MGMQCGADGIRRESVLRSFVRCGSQWVAKATGAKVVVDATTAPESTLVAKIKVNMLCGVPIRKVYIVFQIYISRFALQN